MDYWCNSKYVVLPLFDYDVSLTDGVLISIIFTAVSVVRSYVVRRIFDSKEKTNEVFK